MPNVIRFPHHVRASTVSRAAKAVRISALRPAFDAVLVARTAAHHSAGMLWRCHHLETTDDPTPTSAAMASREGQSSTMARNELICDMPRSLGQLVLKRKANLSLDERLSLGHTVRMSDSESETEYKQQFMDRVAQSRIARGMKQWEMAEALGMTQDKYKQYETRSLLPHRLIGRFCLITRVDPAWLITGHGQKPIKALGLVDVEPPPQATPKRKRRPRAA